tara:strand:+ start:101 stop:253 length:153 start_codon:yes stop_codon:yes gene_type:complete
VSTLENIIIIAGLGSLGAMWVVIVVMMLDTAWDTVGEHVLNIIQKIKGKL